MTLAVDKSLAENYAGYYDEQQDLREWRRLGALDKCSNIVRLCSKLDHDNILEIGCGEGAILECLADLGFGSRFTGLEISPSGVRMVEQKNIPGVEVRLFDGNEVPFPEKRFDLAILSHVLEHVEYPRKLIYEAARVAKHVFVEVPLEDIRRLSEDFVFDRVGHINFYSRKTIRRQVQSCGMEILGDHLSHSSPACYIYRKGKWRGYSSYLIKEAALRAWPEAAIRSFIYHYSLTYSRSAVQDGF